MKKPMMTRHIAIYSLRSIVLIAACIVCANFDISAQAEIELRTDGIVVPRLNTTVVASPAMGQVVYDTNTSQLMYYDGSAWLPVGGPFESDGTTVRQRQGYSTDDFLFGRENLPMNGEFVTDTFLFFDRSLASFRSGTLFSKNHWSPDSIGTYSFAFGHNVKASGSFGATALGWSTLASGDQGATALGQFTIASGNGCTAIGTYNDTIVATGKEISPSSPLFIVGNGDNDITRSNAMVILKNGKIGVGTSSPEARLHLSANSNPGKAHLLLTETDDDGARITLENNQNPNFWTVYGNPKTDASNSIFNIYYQSNVGVGTSGNMLKIFGDGDAILAGTLTQNSDGRLKKDFVEIKDAIQKIQSIQGYSYHWKTDIEGTRKKIGVIAQEVQKVIPELVNPLHKKKDAPPTKRTNPSW